MWWGPILLTALFFLAGCSGSSPRFKSNDSRPSSEVKISQPRFATKVRQEEMREDDKKVDIENVKDRFSMETEPANSTPQLSSPRWTSTTSIDRKKVLTEVLDLLGTPYAFGGSDRDGMDCSAFASQIYGRAVGYPLPRSTSEQYRTGTSVRNGRLQFGDLLFFNTTGESPSHVGIFIGDDLFAHASVSWGVTVSSLQSSYYKKRYIGARRVVE